MLKYCTYQKHFHHVTRARHKSSRAHSSPEIHYKNDEKKSEPLLYAWPGGKAWIGAIVSRYIRIFSNYTWESAVWKWVVKRRGVKDLSWKRWSKSVVKSRGWRRIGSRWRRNDAGFPATDGWIHWITQLILWLLAKRRENEVIINCWCQISNRFIYKTYIYTHKLAYIYIYIYILKTKILDITN